MQAVARCNARDDALLVVMCLASLSASLSSPSWVRTHAQVHDIQLPAYRRCTDAVHTCLHTSVSGSLRNEPDQVVSPSVPLHQWNVTPNAAVLWSIHVAFAVLSDLYSAASGECLSLKT